MSMSPNPQARRKGRGATLLIWLVVGAALAALVHACGGSGSSGGSSSDSPATSGVTTYQIPSTDGSGAVTTCGQQGNILICLDSSGNSAGICNTESNDMWNCVIDGVQVSIPVKH